MPPKGPTSALLMTWGFLRRPLETIDETARRYGDPFCVPTFQGPLVITGHPDGARAIFGADPDTFVSTATEVFARIIDVPSVLIQSGAEHRASRKLLMPPFHGERMRAYGRIMARIARRHARAWSPAQPFKMQEAGRAISLDVILEAVLGVDGGEQGALFRQAMLDLMHSINPVVLALRPLQKLFGKRGPMGRFDRAKDRLRALVADEVERRRAASLTGKEDILSMLLAARRDDGSPLSEPELFGHMLTLLIAGHDTTATALAWAMYFIHREPGVRDRLAAELAALPGSDEGPEPEALVGYRYLDAVCQESQRLRPLVPVISRKLARPFSLLGHELAVGTSVGACASLIHQREELYPEPARFRPERFLERGANAFEYFPFGGGARRCIGAAFAHYEMKIVLGTLLRERRFELLDAEIRSRLQFATVGPATGVRMAAA